MPHPPAQLAVLASLDQSHSIAELATLNGRPNATIRSAVKRLEKSHLVKSQAVGRERMVQAASPLLVANARALIFEVGRPDWARVFYGERPQVLHVLNQIGRAPLTAEVLAKPRRTIYQIIEDMAERGIVTVGSGRRTIAKQSWEDGPRVPGGGFASSGTKYGINVRLKPLADFLKSADEIAAHHRLATMDPHARLLWHLGPELFYGSDSQNHGEQVGGPSALSALGIDLMTSRTYYHRCLRKLTSSDAILQTLLVDPQSKINRSYAALAYEKSDPRDLLEKALIYGLEYEAMALKKYVDTQGETNNESLFLPWSAHERYRKQYGV